MTSRQTPTYIFDRTKTRCSGHSHFLWNKYFKFRVTGTCSLLDSSWRSRCNFLQKLPDHCNADIFPVPLSSASEKDNLLRHVHRCNREPSGSGIPQTASAIMLYSLLNDPDDLSSVTPLEPTDRRSNRMSLLVLYLRPISYPPMRMRGIGKY